jgi:hypothetical protein
VSDVVVDTDVACAILKGQLPDALARQLAGQRLAVTFVTVGELTQWTYLHRWEPQQRAGLQAFFASGIVLSGSSAQRRSGVRSSCRPGPEADPGLSTTPGSPPAASPASFRSPP